MHSAKLKYLLLLVSRLCAVLGFLSSRDESLLSMLRRPIIELSLQVWNWWCALFRQKRCIARVCKVCINGGVAGRPRAYARAPRAPLARVRTWAIASTSTCMRVRFRESRVRIRARAREYSYCTRAFRKLTRVSLALVCQVTCERYCISSE